MLLEVSEELVFSELSDEEDEDVSSLVVVLEVSSLEVKLEVSSLEVALDVSSLEVALEVSLEVALEVALEVSLEVPSLTVGPSPLVCVPVAKLLPPPVNLA